MNAPAYPCTIRDHSGAVIDRAGNVESALSVLYGYLADHDGEPRHVTAPAEWCERLRHHAAINADCWGIPLDVIEAGTGGDA